MNEGTALVDVIIPTRNRLDLTLEAVESVKRQTFSSWNLLIVDDSSDDGSVEELRRVADGHPRISVLERHRQGGQQEARQTGFEASNAPFIALLDSDDLWEPAKLQRQMAHFASERAGLPELGAVLCWHYWIGHDGVARGPRMPRARGRANPLVSTNMSTILLDREAVIRAGGFLPPGRRAVRTSAGMEFYLRITQACDFSVVEEPLVYCRDHAGQRASDGWASRSGADDLAYILDVNQDCLRDYQWDRARLEARTGARYVRAKELRTGFSFLASSLRGAGMRSAFRTVRRYGPYTGKILIKAAIARVTPGKTSNR